MESPKTGFIYVLQMEGHDYYKIGRTVNLNKRVSQISPQMPGRLEIVLAHKVADCFFGEAQLHKDLKHKRLNGEWFSLDTADLDLIESRLLASQAERFLWFIVDKFRNDVEAISLKTIERHGRLITLSARRVDRRITKMWDLYPRPFETPTVLHPKPDVLEGLIG